jgi:hypothetical protein
MFIYKIVTDKKYVDYDTYDSAVVVAHSEDEARRIKDLDNYSLYWVQPIEELTVTLVGIADESITEPCILVASFNAG